MTGAGGQEARFGCEFGSFFSCEDGATPADLLSCGIYSEIAIALKGGPWREASMAMLGMALGLSKTQSSIREYSRRAKQSVQRVATRARSATRKRSSSRPTTSCEAAPSSVHVCDVPV